MMEKFCKLFESEEYGQILLKLDHAEDKEGAELRMFVQPPDLGVCSFALFYGDEDADWDRAEKALADMDQTKAEALTASFFGIVFHAADV